MAGGKKMYDPKRQKMVPKKSKKSKALSKDQKKAVNSLINQKIEVKNAYKAYTTATFNKGDDMLIMASDVFGDITQGAGDNSISGVSNTGSRIGDSINSSGILFNFVLVARNTFIVPGTGSYQLPWVSVRLMVFTARAPKQLLGSPTIAKCLDGVAVSTTLAPTRAPWSMTQYGYVKKILYDKVIKIRNDGLFVNNSIASDTLLGNEFHFKKYIPYKKVVKYTDLTSNPQQNETAEPIYFAILAETAPFLNTGVTGPLVSISGYTKSFYRDA